MIYIITVLLIVSFVLALLSMRDLRVPKEIIRLISIRKHRGSIVFFKDKVRHYSSSSRSSR